MHGGRSVCARIYNRYWEPASLTRDGETTRRGRVRYGGGERQLRGDEGVSIRRPHTRGHGDERQGRTRARGRSLGGRAGIGGDQDGGRDRRAQDRVRAGAVARWHVDAAPENSTLAGSGSGTKLRVEGRKKQMATATKRASMNRTEKHGMHAVRIRARSVRTPRTRR